MTTQPEIGAEVAAHIMTGTHRVDRPQILVLMGLQYAGKSYLSERIAACNYAHFWATKVKQQYGIPNSVMHGVALYVTETLAAAGRNLVIDYVNPRYDDRRVLQEKAAEMGAGYRTVFLDTPKAERMRRRDATLTLGNIPGRRVISLEQLAEFERTFEPPQPGEPALVLGPHDIDAFLWRLANYDTPKPEAQIPPITPPPLRTRHS